MEPLQEYDTPPLRQEDRSLNGLQEPEVKRYSRRIRTCILLGGAVAAWVLVLGVWPLLSG